MKLSLRKIKAVVISMVVLGVVIGAAWFQGSLAKDEAAPTPEKVFPASSKCKKCHIRAFEEYEESIVARAIVTPTFRAMLEDYAGKNKDKRYCLNCHAPQAVVFPDLADTMVKQIVTGDPNFEGVGCIQCHLIKSIDPNVKGHPPIKLEPGRTVFGGYKDPLESKAHDTQYIELYKKSDLCLACHTIAPLAVPEAEAVGSWKGTKAAKEGKTCQTCHMPQGFGESANEEKKRDIAGHEFNGKSPALRRQAFDLDYDTETQGDQTKLTVKVKSLVPHNVPTTHPIWNQIYLQVLIKGRNLTEVFREKRIYGRTFADAKGNETLMDHDAVKLIKDSVLKAEETRTETFTFPTPPNTPSFDVDISLHYATPSERWTETFRKQVEKFTPRGHADPVFKTSEITKRCGNTKVSDGKLRKLPCP
ncbi:MAG TPA: multiheme c-type cytochrome [Nitrospirales bacterium]|jgi:nitrate/TMAO reductase-like tetraheme cytochrome c subunit